MRPFGVTSLDALKLYNLYYVKYERTMEAGTHSAPPMASTFLYSFAFTVPTDNRDKRTKSISFNDGSAFTSASVTGFGKAFKGLRSTTTQFESLVVGS